MKPPVTDISAYEELKEAVLKGNCIAFVGSGPSHGIYPTWGGLVGMLCEACDVPVTGDLDLAPTGKLLSFADQAREKNEDDYNDCLYRVFGGTMVHTSRVYECLLRAPFDAYLTLNFDPLLANAARSHRDGDTKVHCYPSLNVRQMSEKAAFYLHGLILPETQCSEIEVVLTSRDFDRAYSLESRLHSFLDQVLSFSRVIFIGCRLTEKPLQELLSRCAEFRDGFLSGGEHIMLRESLVASPHTNDRSIEEPKGEEIARAKMREEEEHYSRMGISVVWYDAMGDKHSGLVLVLEDMAGVPPIRPKTGFEDYNG